MNFLSIKKAAPSKVFAPTGNKSKAPARVSINPPARTPIAAPVNDTSNFTIPEEPVSIFAVAPTVRFQIDEIIDVSSFNTNHVNSLSVSQRLESINSIAKLPGEPSSLSSILTQPGPPQNPAPSTKPPKRQASKSILKAHVEVFADKSLAIDTAMVDEEKQVKAPSTEPRKRKQKDRQPQAMKAKANNSNEQETVTALPKKKRKAPAKSSESDKVHRFSIFPTSYGNIQGFSKHSLYVKVVQSGSGIEGITLENMENRAVVSAVGEQYLGSSSVQINDVVFAVNHLDARYSSFDQIMKVLTRAPQTIEAYYDTMGYQRSALDLGSGGNRVALKHAVVDSIAMVVFARATTVIL